MLKKLLVGAGVVALLLGLLGFGAVYYDLRDKREKAAAAAVQLGVPDMAPDKVGLADLVRFDKMSEGHQVIAYVACTLLAAGVVCLLGSLAVGAGRKAP